MVGYLGLALRQIKSVEGQIGRRHPPLPCLFLGMSCPHCGHEEPWVEVVRQDDGGYQATLCGHYIIQVPGDHPFRARMLMLVLSWLDVPDHHRGSRRTREGRTPFVRQTHLSAWFGLSQPVVSRIMGYWQRGAWPELLGQGTPEILTTDLIRRIVTVCATFPHWNQEEVGRYLHSQNVAVSQRQVRQAMEQSGWSILRQELTGRYRWRPNTLRLKEKWLVHELLRQVQLLLECLETGQTLPQEERIALTDVQTLAQEAGIEAPPPPKAVPWLLRVERIVFGQWQLVEDDTIRCPDCHSTHIVRKSRKPRLKKFYDADGKLQEVPVYRYYCRNPECARQTFTHLPPGLMPYSRHRLDVRLKAVQAYAWSYSTYRRVGQALQVSEMTIYRWVSAWGYELLPVAALFGLVRSSGVVGVDEKYVLVPKNDKPEGERRRWMYVYLAVDVHTYDLLHIAIYPHNTQETAYVFLLALRAKGYHPQVLVTDLRRDYGPVIAQVFPHAQHHECLFHAEQQISRYLHETLGSDYAQQHPEAEKVRVEIVKVFQVQTRQRAEHRYQALLARREALIQTEPALEWVFEFLHQHWPSLVNSVENDSIPATNNATEMVIRRFDQHYQNFCGFESIKTAQIYLGVFEKVYRFTPFSDDARPSVRGKSPLQLAGYDLGHMPMNWLCRGYCLEGAKTREADYVPNR
jgi:transposase-like protein/DNA-directed RNA polymerase subunit RPC12/RpoP